MIVWRNSDKYFSHLDISGMFKSQHRCSVALSLSLEDGPNPPHEVPYVEGNFSINQNNISVREVYNLLSLGIVPIMLRHVKSSIDRRELIIFHLIKDYRHDKEL